MPNRLAGESSPYLLQHADNPVEWWPWGPEAFAEAKRRDCPVFVSIGYAACHWCHVMAHESFEDPATAAVMNRLYVNVKVDREERPDVDAVYMNAIHVMGEGGGWPLSAWCTPEGKPFFLGTYFPPKDRYGRPGFARVLETLAAAWKGEREKVLENVEGVLDGLRHLDEHARRGATKADAGALSQSLLVAAGRHLVQRADPKHGGLGGAPKFPSSSSHDLLGRAGRLPFGEPARGAFLLWARAMARGGIYDHLGGGFARYTVDERWLVPHFEKMLYDNGQLLTIVSDAIAMGAPPAGVGSPRARSASADSAGATPALAGDHDDLAPVIPETVAWLEREMLDPAGGLYSSLDADSEGEEGKFYVWTPAQVREVLGAADAIQFCRTFGVTDAGNFEHHGTTVLSRVTPRGADSDEAALDEMRARMLAARAKRVRPGLDDKVLSGWNALAISGLVRAYEVTAHEPARALALRVGEFLAREMMPSDARRVARVWKAGKRKLDGTLDDYAFVAAAFLDLAELTGDRAWWDRGAELVRSIRDRFLAIRDDVVIFHMTSDDDAEGVLVHRPESHQDGAIPSGAAVAVECLLRLGQNGGDDDALALAERYLAQRLGGAEAGSPFGLSRLYAALDLYLHGQELVVSKGEGRDALLTAARRAYAPTLQIAGPWSPESITGGKSAASDGRARAFVCRGQTCSAPVTSGEELTALLTSARG